MQQYTKIILPTRPQPDTIIAVFILKQFGEEKFPGIKTASAEIWQSIPPGETEESLDKKGVILFDVGGGKFDHHTSKIKTTASAMIAEYLGLRNDPSIAKLLAFAERDDFHGKGIISNDPLDRAFGFSGLVASLNKSHMKDPVKVLEIALPLIAAHFEEEYRRTKELPLEVENKTKSGEVETFSVKQYDKNLHVIIIQSDNASMSGYLRSQIGGRFDIVLQKLSSGHANIMSRPTKRPRLDSLAALIRIEEATRTGIDLELSEKDLKSPGRIPQIPEWYYDPATNSILNGGLNPREIKPTRIQKEAWADILIRGLSGQI